jgi:hypothetical protein
VRNRSLAPFAALALAGCASWAPGVPELPAASPGTPATLVVVSVAGLTPSAYRAPAGAPPPMHTLAALARSGVSADAVTAVAPASTYPAHATLASGRSPAGHGIVADRRLGERGVRETRFSHASQLRAPTLWQIATEAGRSVAALARQRRRCSRWRRPGEPGGRTRTRRVPHETRCSSGSPATCSAGRRPRA